MNCRDFENDFELYVLGDLDEARSAAIREHMNDCSECQKRRASAERLVANLNESMGRFEPPHAFAESQVARMAEGRGVGRRRSVVRAAVLMAAGLLAGLGLYSLAGRITRDGREQGHDARPVALDSVRILPSPGAQYTVLAPRRVRLEAGTLSCAVRASSERFSIETPAGVATALGTQFTISVQPVEETPMNAKRLATAIVVAAGTVQLVNGFGSADARRGERVYAEEYSAPVKQVSDLHARFGDSWKPVPSTQKPSIPAYALPLGPGALLNADDVSRKLGFSPRDAQLLKNGFVVVPMPVLEGLDGGRVRGDDLVRTYEGLRKADVPIFVTADTLLHMFHVQFDEALKDVEEKEFSPDILALAEMLEKRLGEQAGRTKDPAAREGLRKAWTFAAIGLRALRPGYVPAESIRADVELVSGKIEAHEGTWPAPGIAHEAWSLFRYPEDFSQYVPRGHYVRSEALKRYFVAMTWFGRMTFLLKGGDSHGSEEGDGSLVSGGEAEAQTIAAAAMTRLLSSETLADGRKASEVWERIYTVTSYFVGLSDDLGLPQYAAALGAVMKSTEDLASLADPGRMAAFRAELAKFRAPAIYGGTGAQGSLGTVDRPDTLDTALLKSAGFRLMGQRFVPDSYLLGKLVYPAVGAPTNGRSDMFTCVMSAGGPIRGIPRGLDVMAVLGSERAREILSELEDDAYGTTTKDGDVKYADALEKLRAEFAGISPGDWNRNLYWSWLYALKAIVEPCGDGFPTFMTTEAWRDKGVTTALASWAQLRHDSVLYAKQSYTESKQDDPDAVAGAGYVEPAVEFYGRLLSTVRMMRTGLQQLKALAAPAAERLDGLERILVRLHAISETELANRPLPKEDAAYILEFWSQLSGIRVKYPELEAELRKAEETENWERAAELREMLDPARSMSTALVTDVHSDQNSGMVLGEATGHLDLAVVCVRRPDGTITLAAGPVLSYYEFKHPMNDRLSDEEWRTMLQEGRAPARPEWTGSYMSKQK